MLFYRTWSGICYFGSTDDSTFHKQAQETATITTAKTTLGHLKTIEVRDAMHEVSSFKMSSVLVKTCLIEHANRFLCTFVDQHSTINKLYALAFTTIT